MLAKNKAFLAVSLVKQDEVSFASTVFTLPPISICAQTRSGKHRTVSANKMARIEVNKQEAGRRQAKPQA